MIGRSPFLSFVLSLVALSVALPTSARAQQIEITRNDDAEAQVEEAPPAEPEGAVQIAPSEEDRERARGLFGEAVEHAQNEEWDIARDKFREAYEIIPNETILVNLAGAQIETGRYVEGVASYRLFLDTVTDGPLARLRRSAEQAIEEYEAKIANVTINLANVADGDVLRVDDQEVAASATQELPLNPGDHRLDVQRDGASAAFSEVTLAEGETRVIDIELPVAQQVTVPTPRETANQEFIEINSRRDDEERTSDGGGAPVGLIIGISAGVLVAAGAVVAVLLLTRDDEGGTEPPFQDGNWGVLEVP